MGGTLRSKGFSGPYQLFITTTKHPAIQEGALLRRAHLYPFSMSLGCLINITLTYDLPEPMPARNPRTVQCDCTVCSTKPIPARTVTEILYRTHVVEDLRRQEQAELLSTEPYTIAPASRPRMVNNGI